MLLTIDVGNTNIVFGVFQDKELTLESRIDTQPSRMSVQYEIMLNDILKLNGIDAKKIHGAIVSSVVPTTTTQIKNAILHLFGIEALVVGPGVKTGLNIQIDDPSTLGADLCCGAVAAKEMYKLPCVVIDVGTATKVFAIDKTGALQGGIIYPGIRISLEALADKTAALPMINLDKVDSVIGKNTIDSMRSGILYGMASVLDGFVKRFQAETGVGSVVATGGYAMVMSNYCETKFEVNMHLILDGLRMIYEKTVAKKSKK